MSAPSQQSSIASKPWYMKWWVWLIAAAVAIGGISALINPSGSPAGQRTQSGVAAPAESPTPITSDIPKYASRPELEQFLAESGVTYDDIQVSARKVLIYLPSETSRDDAQRIANEAMQYLCVNTQSPPGYVKTDDQVSPATPGYSAADHPITYAQAEDVCTS